MVSISEKPSVYTHILNMIKWQEGKVWGVIKDINGSNLLLENQTTPAI